MIIDALIVYGIMCVIPIGVTLIGLLLRQLGFYRGYAPPLYCAIAEAVLFPLCMFCAIGVAIFCWVKECWLASPWGRQWDRECSWLLLANVAAYAALGAAAHYAVHGGAW